MLGGRRNSPPGNNGEKENLETHPLVWHGGMRCGFSLLSTTINPGRWVLK